MTFSENIPSGFTNNELFLDDRLRIKSRDAAAIKPDRVMPACSAVESMLATRALSRRLTEKLAEQAQRLCGGRIVSTLEGGYDIAALAHSVGAHIRALQKFAA